jgi:hypothetical protein
MAGPTRTIELADALRRDRRAFLETLGSVAPESLTTPGLVGEWSARELIAHLGYWAGHATEAIHAVEHGQADEVHDERSVDEVNDTVARIARQTDLATVRRREEASVEALLERLEALDPALLDSRLPDGGTLEEAVREDAPGHYREHADQLRAILGEVPRG